MKTLLRISVLFILIIVLISCTTIAPQQPTPPTALVPWKSRQLALLNIERWQLNGKIAVQTSHDSGSATVNWTQNQQQFAISFLGPLGASNMKLTGRPHFVTLMTAEGKQFTAETPEQLLATQWGFNVPVSNLRYWIRGLPVPGLPYDSQFDNNQRLAELTQQGWHIQFQNYIPIGSIDLPSRISITSSLLRVKIVIYQWKISNSR